MLKVILQRDLGRSLRVLCLGSHCDDIEIGCGGTILRLTEEYEDTNFYWIVFSSNNARAEEAKNSANLFLQNGNKKNIIIKKFRNGFFPYVGGKIKDFFEEIKEEYSPDIIFTHHKNDLHQDHRLIAELTWNTFRDHLILEYEIAKYDGDLGSPNFFVHLDMSTVDRKIQNIIKVFKSQYNNSWFDREAFLALPRLRGIESNAPQKYAEAFYCRKMVLL